MSLPLKAVSVPSVSAPQTLRSMATVADPRQEGIGRLDQIALGKSLSGQVMDRLSNGSWLVRVTQAAGTITPGGTSTHFPQGSSLELHMQLPAGIQLGQKLELTLLTREPHLTFGIIPPNTSATTTLSPTARLIDQLLHKAEQTHQPHHVVGQSALLDSAQDPAIHQLANQLQQVLERSGLFYEAHLRQWASGKRSLAQIQREPQNQADPNQPQGLSASAQVPLQLDALEQRHFAWQGEFWPGQPLQWEVSKDGQGKQAPQGGAPTAAWNTVLKLELPELGPVHVRIRLQDQRVQLQVRAEREMAITRLQAGRQHLDDALAASGTALEGFMVQRDANT